VASGDRVPTPENPGWGINMTDDLWGWDATELVRLIRLGRVSSIETVQFCLSCLHAVNPAINAVVRLREKHWPARTLPMPHKHLRTISIQPGRGRSA
jgi:hypothetical protein